MQTSMLDCVESNHRKQNQISQTKKREWSTVDDELSRDACNGRRQQVDRRQQHQTFVNGELAPVIKGQADQDRKDEHVAKRNDQKAQRRRSWSCTARRSKKRGQDADDDDECCDYTAENSQTLVHFRAACCDE